MLKMNSGVDEVEEGGRRGVVVWLRGREGGREEVVWGIKDARRQKGGARGGYLGEFLEVHLKKYFGIFLCNRKMLFLMKKKGFFLGFLRFRLNSDFLQLFSQT